MNGLKCPKCFLIHPDSATKCYCGYEFNGGSGLSVDGSSPRTFKFHGKGFDLFSIFIVNVLLIILTLGIYYFWGKVRIKRYLYSQLEYDGDRFSFHGTGKELFKGGVIAISVFILYNALIYLLESIDPNLATALGFVLSMGLLFLILVAIVLSRRYYLSRTSWRGIRFSFRGKIREFVIIVIKGYFLSAITLGVYFPFFINEYQTFIISNSFFGNHNFKYEGRGIDILKHFIIYLLGFILGLMIFIAGYKFISSSFDMSSFNASAILPITIVVFLGLVSILFPIFWFQYWFAKYKWNNTSFIDAKFKCNFTFWPYVRLKFTNSIIFIFTLGFGWPWVTVRNTKFLTSNLLLKGELDFESIKQDYVKSSAAGESFADILDIDTGLDLGI